MADKTFKCWTDSIGEDDADEFMAWSFERAAVEACEDWFSNRDGWEWLQDGTEVYVSDGKETRRFTISVDHKPVFYAEPDYEYEHPNQSSEGSNG